MDEPVGLGSDLETQLPADTLHHHILAQEICVNPSQLLGSRYLR